MNKSESVFFRVLDIFAHFVLVNMLWIILCVPIITIFPATTALFGVARKWITEGIDAGSYQLFFKLLKENFKKSFIIGILWLVAGFILYLDLSIVLQIDFAGKFFVFVAMVFSSILYVFMTIYLFPILVHYELSILSTIKNALFLSIGHFYQTILSVFIICGAIVFTYYVPIFIIVLGSVLAFTLFHIFHKLSLPLASAKGWKDAVGFKSNASG